MRRVEGSKDIKLLECINPVKNKWRIRWDIQETDEGASYMEEEFLYKPSLYEIKAMIFSWYNSEINAKILSGFVWNDIPVWLSPENQNNFRSSVDLGLIPITLKLGEDTEGKAIYYTFEKMYILNEFYTKSIKFIQETLIEGWKLKDSFNLEDYQ